MGYSDRKYNGQAVEPALSERQTAWLTMKWQPRIKRGN